MSLDEFVDRLFEERKLWQMLWAPLVGVSVVGGLVGFFGDPLVGFLVLLALLLGTTLILLLAASVRHKRLKSRMGDADRILRQLREHVRLLGESTFVGGHENLHNGGHENPR